MALGYQDIPNLQREFRVTSDDMRPLVYPARFSEELELFQLFFTELIGSAHSRLWMTSPLLSSRQRYQHTAPTRCVTRG